LIQDGGNVEIQEIDGPVVKLTLIVRREQAAKSAVSRNSFSISVYLFQMVCSAVWLTHTFYFFAKQ